MTAPDQRLAHLTEICLALPEVTQEMMGVHTRFLVRNKSFAYFLNDHHGDGKVGVCYKAAPGMNTDLVASDATRFYIPAYLGANGWFGLRLDLADIDWGEVAQFAAESYCLLAPKRLVALVARPADELA